MKTTIDIADSLLRKAKETAARRNTTLKEVVEGALRDAFARESQAPRPVRFEPHTVRGRGLRPGLSWDDWSTIRDMSYEGRGG